MKPANVVLGFGVSALILLATCGPVAGSERAANRCARDLFRERVATIAPPNSNLEPILAKALVVTRLRDEDLMQLPFEAYEVQYTFSRPCPTAIVLVQDEKCRVVRDPTLDSSDSPVDVSVARRRTLDQVNNFILAMQGPSLSHVDPVRLARGVTELLYREDGIQALDDEVSLERIIDASPDLALFRSNDGRLNEWRSQARPSVIEKDGRATVQFLSWRRFGGVLSRHQVVIERNRTVDEKASVLATAVGAFESVRYRQ